MATITFSNGKKVNFNGNPTPEDIDFVAQQIGITPDVQPQKSPIPVVKQATEFGVGIGAGLGKAGLGLGQLVLKGANVVGNVMGAPKNQYNPLIQNIENIKQEVYQKPFQQELESGFGKAGSVVSDVATFAEGNAPIVKGQQFLKGVTSGATKNLSGLKGTLAKGTGNFLSRAVPEAGISGGIELAKSGGDTGSATTAGVVSGALSGTLGTGADIVRSLIPKTVRENVSRVLKNTGSKKLGQISTNKDIDNAVGAFDTIRRNSPNIIVKDINDVEKVFEPKKATFFELPQALKQTKDAIYKEYTDIASKAGDDGVLFGQKEFTELENALSKYEQKGYTPAFASKARELKEALYKYGTYDPKDGVVYFNKTSPLEVQDLIQNVNLDANPLSDKAGAQVATDFSAKIRELLDSKIEKSGNPEYQAIRNKYSQLKSVEKDVVQRYKEVLRKANANPNIIDGIASLDAITGIIQLEPTNIGRAGVIGALKKGFGYLRDPEVNLRRAFDILENPQKPKSSNALKRVIGTTENTPEFNRGEQLVDDIRNTPNKKGGFINYDSNSQMNLPSRYAPATANNVPKNPILNTIQNNKSKVKSSTVDNLESEAKKYKSAEEFVKAQGTPVYHGTNRDFTSFDIKRSFPERNNSIGAGEAIYVSPTKELAQKYTKASSNASFDRQVLEEVSQKSKVAGDLMKEIHQNGYEKGWKNFMDKNPNGIKILEKQGIDPNDIGDVANLVRGSKSGTPASVADQMFSAFQKNGYKEIPKSYLEKAKNIGIKSIPSIPKIIEGNILPSAKIKKLGSIKNTIEEATKAKKEGYDGISFINGNGSLEREIAIFNPDIIKTKSQLTDIWKKANQATPNQSLLAEAKKYKSAEEFVKAHQDGKTGISFHITDNPNFKIKSDLIPADTPTGSVIRKTMSEKELLDEMNKSIAIFKERNFDKSFIDNFIKQQTKLAKGGETGELMVTKDITDWMTGKLSGDRKFVAIIDTTGNAKKTTATRGFGNETLIQDPQNSKLIGLYPVKEAKSIINKIKKSEQLTKSQLTDIWKKANKK